MLPLLSPIWIRVLLTLCLFNPSLFGFQRQKSRHIFVCGDVNFVLILHWLQIAGSWTSASIKYEIDGTRPAVLQSRPSQALTKFTGTLNKSPAAEPSPNERLVVNKWHSSTLIVLGWCWLSCCNNSELEGGNTTGTSKCWISQSNLVFCCCG